MTGGVEAAERPLVIDSTVLGQKLGGQVQACVAAVNHSELAVEPRFQAHTLPLLSPA